MAAYERIGAVWAPIEFLGVEIRPMGIDIPTSRVNPRPTAMHAGRYYLLRHLITRSEVLVLRAPNQARHAI